MAAMRNRSWTSIDGCLVELWKQWSHQATQLQMLWADVENRKKAGDNFHKMDEESIIVIREELSDNFFSLAKSHLGVLRRLVQRLDDDQLGTQLHFEKHEQELRKKGVGERATTITISDEEQPE